MARRPKSPPSPATRSGPVRTAAAAVKTEEARRLQVRKLRNQFRQAHADGVKALEKGDYDRLGSVIARERAIIDQQAAIVAMDVRNPRAKTKARKAKKKAPTKAR